MSDAKEPNNLHAIKGPAPDQGVIDVLERMLARARSGELTGAVVVAHTPSGVACDWGGVWSASDMNWALQCWSHQVIKSALDD